MKIQDINIRDPFILVLDDKYYMYGTRANNFGVKTRGFDVYVSDDLENWSEPIQCFDSEKWGFDKGANWAPEVYKYNGKFYMFATFVQKDGLRGTFGLRSDSPLGPFELVNDNALTPKGWECLDGTLYINKKGKPYLVFCHEHTQIIDGTMCYVELNSDLTASISEPITLFSASQPFYIEKSSDPDYHYITDGPFLLRNKAGELFMLWSTFVEGKYAECIAKSDNGDITGNFEHLTPISAEDGGHGMVFETKGEKLFVMHSPNIQGLERPVFFRLSETENSFIIEK